MKIFNRLVFLGALATMGYEIMYLVENGTAGNVDNIVIVMVLGIMIVLSMILKSAFKVIKWLFLAAIIYAVGTHISPLLSQIG